MTDCHIRHANSAPIKRLRMPLLVMLLLLQLTSLPLLAKTTGNLQKWSHLPSAQLLQMGQQYKDTTLWMTDSALVCYTIVANRYFAGSQDTEEVRNSIKAMIGIGCIYYYLYFDYEKALYHLNEALQVATKHHQNDMVASIHFDLSNLYTVFAQINHPNTPKAYEEALRYLRLAQQEAQGTANLTVKLNITAAFCDYAITTGHLEEVKADLAAFDTLTCDTSLAKYQYTRCMRRAVGQLHEGNEEQALYWLDQSLPHARLVSTSGPLYTRMYATVCASKAHILSRKGRFREAITHLENALQMARRYDAKDIKADLCRLLYLYHEALGNREASTHYHLAYYQQKDSLLLNNKLGDIQELKFRYELEQANSEIRQMARQARIQRIATTIALLVAAVILTMLILLWRNYRLIHAKNAVLYQKSQESLKAPATSLPASKYEKSPLDLSVKQELMERIQKAMADPATICMPDFTIALLAQKVNAKPRHVSQVINEKYERGFTQMLCEYRIKEACRRMSDPQHYGHLSIEGLSTGLGFKSRSNFVSNFKRIVGMSPSEYKNHSKNAETPHQPA